MRETVAVHFWSVTVRLRSTLPSDVGGVGPEPVILNTQLSLGDVDKAGFCQVHCVVAGTVKLSPGETDAVRLVVPAVPVGANKYIGTSICFGASPPSVREHAVGAVHCERTLSGIATGLLLSFRCLGSMKIPTPVPARATEVEPSAKSPLIVRVLLIGP